MMKNKITPSVDKKILETNRFDLTKNSPKSTIVLFKVQVLFSAECPIPPCIIIPFKSNSIYLLLKDFLFRWKLVNVMLMPKCLVY